MRASSLFEAVQATVPERKMKKPGRRRSAIMRHSARQYPALAHDHNSLAPHKRLSKTPMSKFLKAARMGAALLSLLLLASLIGPELRVEASDEMAPRITIQPNDLIVTEGESSEMNCDAEGWPTPTIDWYHNGHNITSKTRSRTTLGGSIMFLDVKPTTSGGWQSDTGTYHCVARNSLGQATSRNASLQVACKLNIAIVYTLWLAPNPSVFCCKHRINNNARAHSFASIGL